MRLIAELATGHGGDLGLAAEMIHAAAEAGADTCKVQTYDLAKLNPKDPQREWLVQSHLDRAAHERLMAVCQQAGVRFLSTPFDAGSLQMLRELGLKEFKIASSESGNGWWRDGTLSGDHWFVSHPWGMAQPNARAMALGRYTHLTAIPLYPTPLEVVGRATMLDGWSDHGDGIAACLWAIAQDVQVLEVHLTIPGARQMPFDKTPAQIRELRQFADDCATMRSGVATGFRERWQRA